MPPKEAKDGWDSLDCSSIIKEIEILRGEVADRVIPAILHPEFRTRPDRVYSKIESKNNLDTLTRAFDSFKKSWEVFFGWRLPRRRTKKAAAIGKVFKDIEEAILGKKEFSSSEAACHEVMEAYFMPFELLKNLAYELSAPINPVDEFRRERTKELDRFRKDHEGKTTIFVSINHGSGKDEDPADVKSILRSLKIVKAEKDDVDFCWARDEDYCDEVKANTHFLLHACDAMMAFFTESNLTERKVEHNPNVCMELGYMTALRKPCGVFMFRKSRSQSSRAKREPEDGVNTFALIKDASYYPYSDASELDEKIPIFLGRRLQR